MAILDHLVIDYVTTPVLGECLLNKLMYFYKEYIQNQYQSVFDYMTTAYLRACQSKI